LREQYSSWKKSASSWPEHSSSFRKVKESKKGRKSYKSSERGLRREEIGLIRKKRESFRSIPARKALDWQGSIESRRQCTVVSARDWRLLDSSIKQLSMSTSPVSSGLKFSRNTRTLQWIR